MKSFWLHFAKEGKSFYAFCSICLALAVPISIILSPIHLEWAYGTWNIITLTLLYLLIINFILMSFFTLLYTKLRKTATKGDDKE